VRAGIIAAGDGSRMRAAGLTTPKPLLRVGGVPLIERTLRALVEAGIDEIAFVVNEKMASIVDVVARLDLGVPVHGIVATTPSSMHSLQALAPHLEGDRFVLCTVDSIVRPADFSGFVRRFGRRPAGEIQLSYTDFVDDENPLRIAVKPEGRVTHLGAMAASSPYVTLGLYGMGPEIFPLLHRSIAEGAHRLRTFLGLLLAGGMAVHGHHIRKGIDVDRPEDILVAEAFVLEEGPRT